jgi:membrane-bound metal-dependent hydrolase YbcI (DUF457 family)
MDNVTHTLFALTLARTPLGRAGRGTTAALIIASNIPDADIVSTVGGATKYLAWHRGPTHGPLGIVVLGVATGAIVWAAGRAMDARARKAASAATGAPNAAIATGSSEVGPSAASLPMLATIATIGALFHVLMDFPTSYGTRLFSPFDWHWWAVDWMPIIDVYLLFALAAGLLFGRGSPTAQRRLAAIVLVLMAGNYGLRAVSHHRALATAPRLFGPLLPKPCDQSAADRPTIERWPRNLASTGRDPSKRCLVELVALPTFFSPFKWRVVAHLSNAYEVHDVDLLDGRFRQAADASEVMWRTTLRFPNVWTAPVWTAASTELGKVFLGFARLPAARSFVDPFGTATVRWNDIRFIGMRPALGSAQNDPFSAMIRIAPDGHILAEQLIP